MTYTKTPARIAGTLAAQKVSRETFLACPHCDSKVRCAGYPKHEKHCFMKPENQKKCFCGKFIKNYRTAETCSYACANRKFRSGHNHPNWKPDAYRTTCFAFHKRQCVVCDETNIVEVHHYDGNHDDSSPGNLVPLCPTHHQYCHSRYKRLIQGKIDIYVKDYLAGISAAASAPVSGTGDREFDSPIPDQLPSSVDRTSGLLSQSAGVRFSPRAPVCVRHLWWTTGMQGHNAGMNGLGHASFIWV